jgi:hypothetical protein
VKAAQAKENYYKKKEEAAKALNKFLQRKAPQLLHKFEEEYREGREESVTATKTSAILDKNGAGIDFMEDNTQWMDDLPDLARLSRNWMRFTLIP